jgi:hypothetical protein
MSIYSVIYPHIYKQYGLMSFCLLTFTMRYDMVNVCLTVNQ